MKCKFYAYAHPNILGTHKNTLEFTKDKDITTKGDCIIGVNSDFDLNEIKKFIKNIEDKKITITMETLSKSIKIKEKIFAEINPNFNSDKEFVIRKSDFVSERTFAINSSKSAFELNRQLINFLKEKKNRIMVVVENRE